MNILQCNNVQLMLNKHVILHNISFSIQKGERVGLIGPSGSGKSSLFRLLNLLSSPTQGDIIYKNKNIQDYAPTELRRSISYILQKPYLFATTVQENLFYPYQLLNQKPNLDEIGNYLSKANLSKNTLDKKNTALSGGEQQRIALIRSLLMKPEVILLDEITAALDEENTLLIEKLLTHEQQVHNITLLFITHNISQVKRLAQKVLYLEVGTIRFFGTDIDFFSQKGEANE